MSTDVAASAGRVGVLVRHNLLLRLRDPGPMISYILLPMVIMLMFKPLYERAFAARDAATIQVVTGPLIMFSVFTLAIVGNSILTEREQGTWDRLRSSAATSAEMLVGKILLAMGILVAQQLLLLGYGCLVVGLPLPSSPGLVLVSMLAWAFALVALGAALATVMRSHAEVGMASDIGATLISAMGGALIPIALMPGWAQVLAHVSPGFYGLSMLQSAVRGDAAGTFGPAAVLLAFGLVVGAFAVRRITLGWDRSTVQ